MTSDTQHSPTPWTVDFANVYGATIVDADNKPVAFVHNDGANLRLLMAAPALLIAAQRARQRLGDPGAISIAKINDAMHLLGAAIDAAVRPAERFLVVDHGQLDSAGPLRWRVIQARETAVPVIVAAFADQAAAMQYAQARNEETA